MGICSDQPLAQGKDVPPQLEIYIHTSLTVHYNNKDERVEMKKPPEIGYRIAMSSPELVLIVEYILSHHKR